MAAPPAVMELPAPPMLIALTENAAAIPPMNDTSQRPPAAFALVARPPLPFAAAWVRCSAMDNV